MPLRVIKVGGSLLSWSSFTQRLDSWLAHQPKANNLILVGGGGVVDAIRDIESPLGLTHQQCHDAALEGMALNARLLACALWNRGIEVSVVAATMRFVEGGNDEWTNAPLEGVGVMECVEDEGKQGADAPRSPGPRLAILEPVGTVRALKIELPATWEITSDSIAAAIAHSLRAQELVLLKSRSPSPGVANDGLVDPAFGRYASALSFVRIVDLRSEDFPTCTWPPNF